MTLLNRSWMVPLVCGVGMMASPLVAQDSTAEKKDEGPMEVAPSPKLSKLNDFRDQAFGTPFSEFKGLELEEDRGPLKLYTSEDDKQLIGPVLLDEIVYYFFQDKFAAVGLHTEDGSDSSNAIRILEAAYGPGTPLEGEATYVWKGEKVSVRLSVSPDGEGEILISNNDLYKAFIDWENKAIEEAAKELQD